MHDEAVVAVAHSLPPAPLHYPQVVPVKKYPT